MQELEAILSSYHFRGSKRYPALLQYVVDAALENRIRRFEGADAGC